MLDVNNYNALKTYLGKKEIFGSESSMVIEVLPGGVSNSVLKITSDKGEFVLKQALKKLKVQAEWNSDVERCNLEKNALKFLNKIIPESVPDFVYEDEDNFLFIMTCVPGKGVTWKSMLMKNECSDSIAKSVGEVLGNIHQITHELDEPQKLFGDKKFFWQLRIDPFFKFIKTRHPQLATNIDQHIANCLNNEHSLVLGDYSPKNILINEEKIIVIDFEVTHYGDTSFDIAFLTSHLLLKALKFRENRNSYYQLLRQFIAGYFSKSNFSKRSLLEAASVKQLAWILLARVDGKSPVEYLSSESEKELVRNISYVIIDSNVKTYNEVIQIHNAEVRSYSEN